MSVERTLFQNDRFLAPRQMRKNAGSNWTTDNGKASLREGVGKIVYQPGGQYRVADSRGGDKQNTHRPHSLLANARSSNHLSAMTRIALLPDRAVIAIAGPDRRDFLQGLVSQDVNKVAPGHAAFAALLTPQGRYRADFFIFDDAEHLLLDVERPMQADVIALLSRYQLRAKVTIEPGEHRVYVLWGGHLRLPQGTIVAPDPRLPGVALRVLSLESLQPTATASDWDEHRLAIGLPDGTRDLEPGKTLLLEAGFDELSGISWTKGCYMGQELTARTRYRGLIKRRLLPVDVNGPLPQPGTTILRAGKEVGNVRSGRGNRALAMIRLDALDGPLVCGDATLIVMVPDWIRLPEGTDAS